MLTHRDRVCTKGECVSPAHDSEPAEEQLLEPSVQPRTNQRSGRSAARAQYARRVHSGAITGIVGSVMSLSFGLVAAATENYWVALGSGSGALLATAITVPIAGGPAGRARNYFRSKGVFVRPSGLAIAGWVSYGFAVADGAILVGLGIADAPVTDGQIFSATILGTVAGALISADALLLRDQLRRSSSSGSMDESFGKRRRRTKLRVAVAPVIGPDLKQLAIVGIF
jgi:hypothetical protein